MTVTTATFTDNDGNRNTDHDHELIDNQEVVDNQKVVDTDAPAIDENRPSWRERITIVNQHLADPSTPLVLTLIVAMLATSQSWYVAVPVVVLGVVGLALPTTRHSPRLWWALAMVLGAAAWSQRWTIDNHQFLIVYWCLALGLAAASRDPVRARLRSARALVGVVFVLAVAWKLVSPDFVNGSFMRFTLLTDARFSEVAALVGGMSPADLAANRADLAAVGTAGGELAPLTLRASTRIDLVATALTWWTLLIEGAVALSFVVPWRRLARHRDVLLIAFIVTTYVVAPVVGFGWVLVALGLAQYERTRPWLPVAYLAAFLVVQAGTAPWTSLLGVAS